MRKSVFFFCAFVISIASIKTALADEALSALRIDIAGSQRMLTQKIAKSACYLGTFSDVAKHHKMLIAATSQYQENLDILRNGSAALNLPSEQNENILSALEAIKPHWHLLSFGAQVLAESHTQPGLDVDMIAQSNLPSLKQSHAIVEEIETTYSTQTSLDPMLARAINVAGRQRMLSQKAAKEFCLISYGYKADENRQSLLETVYMFDEALMDMIGGNEEKGILGAPTAETRRQLRAIKQNWDLARAPLLDAANGVDSKSAEFQIVSDMNDLILKRSDELVKMLVAYSTQVQTNDTDN